MKNTSTVAVGEYPLRTMSMAQIDPQLPLTERRLKWLLARSNGRTQKIRQPG